MSEREELSRKLLEENGLQEARMEPEHQTRLKERLAMERHSDARVRTIMLWAWALLITLMVVGALVPELASTSVSEVWMLAISVGTIIAFAVAATLSVMYALRTGFGRRGIEERLERIEEQLARLEAAQGESGGDTER